jgi:hypothetical protein
MTSAGATQHLINGYCGWIDQTAGTVATPANCVTGAPFINHTLHCHSHQGHRRGPTVEEGKSQQITSIRSKGPPDARIWLMGNMKNARFVRGRDADKHPSPPIIPRRRLKTKAILSIAGVANLLAPSAVGATR